MRKVMGLLGDRVMVGEVGNSETLRLYVNDDGVVLALGDGAVNELDHIEDAETVNPTIEEVQ